MQQSQQASNPANDSARAPVIVAGAGPVGVHFVEELARLDPGRPIKLFSGEPFRPYDRVKLSQLLARDIDEPAIYQEFHRGEHLELIDDCRVVAIDREARRIRDSRGLWHEYDKLVLALGSAPFVPGIPNIDCRNVFTFRDLKDTQALAARNLGSRRTVIIGGGLLGLETARAMQRNNTEVSVVQMAGHLMNQQLDAGAGRLLEAAVARLGITVICNARAAEIVVSDDDYNKPRPEVGGVRLDNGQLLRCDTVIVAAGIRPRIELALQHGLNVGRGIRVNEHLQTSDPDIYAIGECVQFGEQLYGLVAPGREHAAVAAHHLCGRDAVYRGTINATALKVVGQQVFSVGEINTQLSASIRSAVYQDPGKGIYRAIFTVNDRLTGALALGDWPEQHRIRASIGEGRKLQFWNRLQFRLNGFLWRRQEQEDVRQWPAGMVVCNCTGATRGQISAACARGATSLEELAAATRASTVCGSCKPLLAAFTGTELPAAPDPRQHWLWRLSLGALALLCALLVFGPLPYSTSVQGLRPDLLWIDGLAKQISGFTLLGLAAISLLMSLSKRWRPFARLGRFTGWRVFHTVMGAAAVLVLLLHTGVQLGSNLNRWLMLDFLLLLGAGALAGIVIGRESLLSARAGRRARSWMTWTHTLLFWPLPVLLGFHIVSVYYF